MKKEMLWVLALVLSTSGTVFAATATVALKGTSPAMEKIAGQAVLTDTAEGLKVTVDLQNVPPGKHGFHIHEGDSCADEGRAAGGHFNPDKAPHGLLSKDGFSHAHAGDLGNVEIGADGTGKVDTVMSGLTLTGEGAHRVAGRTIILHEKEDDFGQPTGNAGGRIACGQIQLTE